MIFSIALPLLWLALQAAALDPQEAGLKALEAKQYLAAIAEFEKAIAAGPRDYAAHFHLGLARSLAGQNAAAAAAYRKTLELKPGLYEAQLNLGIVLLDLKQAAEAVEILKPAVAKKPREFRPNYYFAEAQLSAGQPAEAEAAFRTALAADPKSSEARGGLGRALLRQDKRAEAAELLAAAADTDGLLELAALHEKAGESAQAIAIYRSFNAANPKDAAVSERLGVLMMNSGRAGEAIPHLENAVKLSPTAANRFALATAYLRDKQPAKATSLLSEAIQADSKNPELYIASAGLHRDQKDFKTAAEQFWRATQLKPESKEAWSGLATMLLSLENFPQAVAAFDKLESLGDANAGLYFLRALAFDKTKNYKPAQANYQKFLAMSENKFPDEEFKARQRLRVIEKELARR
jgi:tetratricopeptide (TPR) repeat protein